MTLNNQKKQKCTNGSTRYYNKSNNYKLTYIPNKLYLSYSYLHRLAIIITMQNNTSYYNIAVNINLLLHFLLKYLYLIM